MNQLLGDTKRLEAVKQLNHSESLWAFTINLIEDSIDRGTTCTDQTFVGPDGFFRA